MAASCHTGKRGGCRRDIVRKRCIGVTRVDQHCWLRSRVIAFLENTIGREICFPKVLISDGVSTLGFGLGLETSLLTHFCESRSRRFQVSFRSRRLQVFRLGLLQRNGSVKFLQFNDSLFVVFAGKKHPKHVGKMPEMWKNSIQKWWRVTIFF